MTTRINESKTLTKHISCKWKCKFDGKDAIQIKKRNNNKRQCECKNPRKNHDREKDYIWNPSKCICENGKYLESIISDSVIVSDKAVEMTKTIP